MSHKEVNRLDPQNSFVFSRNLHRSFSAYSTCLQRLTNQAFHALSAQYALEKPLTFSHNFILQALYYQEKPLTLAEISRRGGQAMPNVSVAANELRANGLILCQRLADDRRKYAVELTALGRRVCDDYLTHHLPRIYEHLFAGFTSEERDALFRALEHLENNAKQCLMQMDDA